MRLAAKLQNLFLIILIAACLAAGGWWIFRNYFDTYHLQTIVPGVLYRDGVRSPHQFELAMKKTRVRTIVSLVDDSEIQHHPFTDEVAYCRQHGIQIIRVPITLGGWPMDDQVSQFLTIAQNPAYQPVLVHCAQGVRRTGMMIAAYQLSVLKFDKTRAEAAIQSFGHSQRTINDVKRFIEAYDPQSQRMSQQLPMSQE